MQFSLRDALLLVTVIGLSLAWWIDRRSLSSSNKRLRSDNLELTRRVVAAEAFPEGEARIKEIHKAARQSPPSSEVAAEIIDIVRRSEDFRLRVRAMAILPLLNERHEATAALVDVLRERRGDRTGGGTVQGYAASYLSQMNVTSATVDIASWRDFLKRESPYDPMVTAVLIESAEKDLTHLRMNIEPGRTSLDSQCTD